MMKTKRTMFLASLPVLALGIMMVPGTACDGDELCCTENDFQVGGSVSLDAAGNAQAQASLQAIADLGGVASAMIEDITSACRNIATDLDATAEEKAAAEAKQNKNEKAEAWCNLAISKIGTIKGEATFKLSFNPPKCEASFSAKADCSAKCSVEGQCDANAKLPTCEGGKLEVSCEGSCSAEGGASVSCTGECGGSCEGSCDAKGGVECAGKCEGKCTAKGDSSKSGVNAEGKCEGICEGKCEVTAPGVTCSGTCSGKCSGECKAQAGLKVQCDGKCSGKAEPIKCSGGEMKIDCKVDAKCDADCSASVKAKAACTPPELTIEASGGVEANIAKLRATVQANFGVIATIKTKLELVGNVDLEASVKAVGSLKPVCIPAVLAAAVNAGKDIGMSLSLTGKLVGSVQ